jgi:pimeloyl-ACP methyl ester carboxylesterase
VRAIGRLLLALVLVAAVSAAAVVLWLALRDPIAALPRAGGKAVATGVTPQTRDGRVLQHVVLEAPGVGRIGLAISLPDPLPPRPLPIVMVLGGLATGERNISHIPGSGENAIVGYDWPIPTRLPQGWALLRQAPEFYDRALSVPGQIAAALDWIAGQGWADAGRVSLLGFSLGALAAPAAARLAERDGRAIGWTALAYGGSPVGALLASNPYLKPRWAAPYLALAADLLFRPVEPAEHLPHLASRFLLVGGRDDTFVPEAAARRMRDLAPEPKTIVLLEGDHMGVGANQQALLAQIVDVTTRWLAEQEAINPPR